MRSLSSIAGGSEILEPTAPNGSSPEQNNKTYDVEKGHRDRDQNDVGRVRDSRQKPTASTRYSRHRTWYSATVSDVDDLERMIVEAQCRNNDDSNDAETPLEEEEGEEAVSGSLHSSDESRYIHAIPESGIGIYDERTDTYNLMPSMALWNRESIMI